MIPIGKLIRHSARLCRCAAVLMFLTVLAAVSSAAQTEPAQKAFSSAEEARQALLSVVQAKDHAALRLIFGPVTRELEPVDPQEQSAEFEHFARHVAEGVELVMEGEERAHLVIGAKKWPFPVQIVKKDGVWLFDTVAGREEILNRRIGHNELHVIKASRAYVEAQREYYTLAEPDGDQLPKYAQQLFSTPGRRDGLYWPTPEGAKESPLGPLVARAEEQGQLQKHKATADSSRPFHGYYLRVLKRQGANAPGSTFNYVINGNMVAGFALVAYPAKWGVSGITTFIVNQRGRVYQKDLGPKTSEVVRKMKAYNPDLSWRLVSDQ